MRYHVFKGDPYEGPILWVTAADGEDALEAVNQVAHQEEKFGDGKFLPQGKERAIWAIPVEAWEAVSAIWEGDRLTLGDLSHDEARALEEQRKTNIGSRLGRQAPHDG